MGVKQSVPTVNIDVLGASNSGKTQFLDMLVFGGDTTRCTTFGTYLAAYLHDGIMLNFTEFGGSERVRSAWCTMLTRETRPAPDALYLFIDKVEPLDERLMQKIHGYFCFALSALNAPRPLCVVFNERHNDTVDTHAFSKRISALFQLKLLAAQGWPIQAVTLQYADAVKWARVVEIMFDWTVENGKIE